MKKIISIEVSGSTNYYYPSFRIKNKSFVMVSDFFWEQNQKTYNESWIKKKREKLDQSIISLARFLLEIKMIIWFVDTINE